MREGLQWFISTFEIPSHLSGNIFLQQFETPYNNYSRTYLLSPYGVIISPENIFNRDRYLYTTDRKQSPEQIPECSKCDRARCKSMWILLTLILLQRLASKKILVACVCGGVRGDDDGLREQLLRQGLSRRRSRAFRQSPAMIGPKFRHFSRR